MDDTTLSAATMAWAEDAVMAAGFAIVSRETLRAIERIERSPPELVRECDIAAALYAVATGTAAAVLVGQAPRSDVVKDADVVRSIRVVTAAGFALVKVAPRSDEFFDRNRKGGGPGAPAPGRAIRSGRSVKRTEP